MARVIKWSGYDWTVRPKSDRKNPGPNAWGDTDQNVRVDANGHLILSIWKDGTKWRCADVTSDKAFGYGNYKWVVGTDVATKLDPNVILGLFTYDIWDSTPPGFNEVDIEFTKWGDKNEKRNTWLSVQPDIHGSTILPSNPPFTSQFTWYPERIAFKIQDASKTTIYYRSFNKRFVPNDHTRAILDLWLMQGRAPLNGQRQAVRINSFKHTPLP